MRLSRFEEDGELTYMHDKPEKWLDPVLPVRDLFLSGDLTPLYLGWRMVCLDPYDRPLSPMPPEPPRPASLDRLPKPLKALDEFLRPPALYD